MSVIDTPVKVKRDKIINIDKNYVKLIGESNRHYIVYKYFGKISNEITDNDEY